MFGFLRQPRPLPSDDQPDVVGCFGKLPVRADFLKHNSAHREVQALDRWLQEGFGLLSRRGGGFSEDSFFAAPAQCAVFAGAPGERAVVAVLAPSRDGGGRAYPFVVFGLPGNPVLNASPWLLPLVYGAFLDAAGQMAAQPWGREPLATVLAWVDGLRDRSVTGSLPELRALAQARLGEVPISQVWQCLPDPRPPGRARFLDALLELLGEVVRRGPGRIPWGFTLPLPPGEGRTTMVLFWLRLLDRVLINDVYQPSYFWSASGCNGLTVFLRPAPATWLLHLLGQGPRDGLVMDVAAEARAVIRPRPRALELAEAESGSALAFIDRLCRGRLAP